MELFVKAIFLFTVFGFVARIMCIGFLPYPRTVDKGTDAVSAILSIPFLIWAAVLIW